MDGQVIMSLADYDRLRALFEKYQTAINERKVMYTSYDGEFSFVSDDAFYALLKEVVEENDNLKIRLADVKREIRLLKERKWWQIWK